MRLYELKLGCFFLTMIADDRDMALVNLSLCLPNVDFKDVVLKTRITQIAGPYEVYDELLWEVL